MDTVGEWHSDNITVNSVVPGLIGTEWRESWADTKAAQAGKSRADQWRRMDRHKANGSVT